MKNVRKNRSFGRVVLPGHKLFSPPRQIGVARGTSGMIIPLQCGLPVIRLKRSRVSLTFPISAAPRRLCDFIQPPPSSPPRALSPRSLFAAAKQRKAKIHSLAVVPLYPGGTRGPKGTHRVSLNSRIMPNVEGKARSCTRDTGFRAHEIFVPP